MTNDPDREDAAPARSDQTRPIVPKSASESLRPQAGTPPPRRSRRSRSQFVIFLNFVMSCVVLVTILALGAVYYGKLQFEAEGPSDTTQTVLIPQNTGSSEIASLLERRGLISDSRIFRLGLRAYGVDSSLKAGEYEIRAGASMHKIMDLLESGRSVLHSLTIPEGLTVHEAFERIASMEELSGEMPEDLPPEGSIAAETIRFTRGLERKAVIERLMQHQEEMVRTIWERRDDDLPVDTIEEFVTLASIVEKETARADERSRVAAVFINRLRQGMRLQSDPTIIYGLFGGEGRPDGRPIYQSDLESETEYNTYVIPGLPPGPIAIPGRASLEAVANPSETDDLYFVADGTGGHAFAETLDEHNRNVARWRAIERDRAEAAAEEAAAQEGAAADEE